MLTTVLKQFDTFVFIAKTSSCIMLSLTGIVGYFYRHQLQQHVYYQLVIRQSMGWLRRSIIETKNNMKNIDKQLNLSINYIEIFTRYCN